MLVLERLMRGEGWSRAKLARRAEMNQVTVGAIINGRIRPYPVQLERLASALGWPVANAHELMTEVDEGE
jgi:transcriptional regulator with XRE-family HTH domain